MKFIDNLLFALASLVLPKEVVAAERARRRLRENNQLIAKAELSLANAKTQRADNARTDAAALKDAIANATSASTQAEQRRQAEIDDANAALDRRIASLEAAIKRAKDESAELLGDIAEKQAKDRDAEQARIQAAESALDEVSAAAGNTAE